MVSFKRKASGDAIFKPNKLKENQFWYLLQNLDGQYGFGDFGFVGSKKVFDRNQVLTIEGKYTPSINDTLRYLINKNVCLLSFDFISTMFHSFLEKI